MTQKYSINQIKNAGKRLIENIHDEEALEILSYWRADHAEPLEQAYKLIEKYARQVDPKALVAKRLKRTPSIVNKLRLLEGKLQLSTMNDIGGCRIIVKNKKTVYKLVKEIKKKSSFELRIDYIETPRNSGYRSVHLIGKFKNKEGIPRNVELQIRTRIQHSWATAVEIVDIFTSQSIKSNMGEENWAIFFKQTSEQFSFFEDNPYLNSSSDATKEDIRFIRHYLGEFGKNYRDNSDFRKSAISVAKLCKQLSILEKFQMFTQSLHVTSKEIERNGSEGYYLITIDYDGKAKYSISLKFFDKKDIDTATNEYSQYEKQSFLDKKFLTALIATSKVDGIEEAYPNFFADSTKFIERLSLVLAAQEKFGSPLEKLSAVISSIMPKKLNFEKIT